MTGKQLATILPFSIFLLISCSTAIIEPEIEEEGDVIDCSTSVINRGLVYSEGAKTYLLAGADTTWQFNITNWTLRACNLKNGSTRENFPALIHPKFDRMSDVVDNFSDLERVLVLRGNNSVKLYPYSILVKHETLNDNIDGKPIIVVYCFLADLTAIYNSTYCGSKLTFAISGYTYSDPKIADDLESFILWDRDTESLWWPINEKAVSGDFKGTSLIKHTQSSWEEIRWPEARELYPNAQVLQNFQKMDIPNGDLFVGTSCN